jgi:glycosyltransferase involved in cell wall biosynthesis
MQQICFVLPVYNHPRHLPQLLAHLQQYQLPVILVDDGSDSDCQAVIAALQQQYQFTVLRHLQNQGKGQAVMTGLNYAHQQQYSHALQIDVDGQHHWPDIARFLAASRAQPEAVILGQPCFDQTVPKARLYGRYATHIWVWINSLSFAIQDSMCGFRIYPVAACARLISRHSLLPRMGFDSEILVRLSWQGYHFVNLSTRVSYPEDGLSHFDVWQDNLALSKMHAKLFVGMLWRAPCLIARKLRG